MQDILVAIQTGDEMATAQELTGTVNTLKERVENHITFFRCAVVVLAGWLAWLTNLSVATKNNVVAIRQGQQEITAKLAKADIIEQAALPQDQFKSTLPDLKNAVSTARQHRVDVPPAVVGEIKQKLIATDKATPGLWPAAAALITYQSQAAKNWNVWNLPSCIDQMHRRKLLQDVSPGEHTVAVGPVEVSNCQIVLDSPEADKHISFDLSMGSIIFHHCVIFYNGGQIMITPVKVAANSPARINGDLQFDDCLFVFNLPDNPSEQAQKFAEALLRAPSPDSAKFNPTT